MPGMLKSWKLFELCLLAVSLVMTIVLSFLTGDTPIGFLASAFGIICVVLTAKGSVWSYLFGYVNILAYAYVAWRNGLYGEMGLNLFFFLPTSIVGFIMWKKNIANVGHLVMRKLSVKANVLLGIACVVAIAAMGYALSRIKGQNTPYIDATTNVLSIGATILMMMRYREQWTLYLVLDVFTVLMWVLRMVQGSPDGLLMVVMWTTYLINACYGYWNWSRGAKMEEKQ